MVCTLALSLPAKASNSGLRGPAPSGLDERLDSLGDPIRPVHRGRCHAIQAVARDEAETAALPPEAETAEPGATSGHAMTRLATSPRQRARPGWAHSRSRPRKKKRATRPGVATSAIPRSICEWNSTSTPRAEQAPPNFAHAHRLDRFRCASYIRSPRELCGAAARSRARPGPSAEGAQDARCAPRTAKGRGGKETRHLSPGARRGEAENNARALRANATPPRASVNRCARRSSCGLCAIWHWASTRPKLQPCIRKAANHRARSIGSPRSAAGTVRGM